MLALPRLEHEVLDQAPTMLTQCLSGGPGAAYSAHSRVVSRAAGWACDAPPASGSPEALGRGADLKGRMEFATTVAAALCETPGPVVSLESLARYGILPNARPTE